MTNISGESSSVTSVRGSLVRNIGGSPPEFPGSARARGGTTLTHAPIVLYAAMPHPSQPALQELRGQPLEVARDQREAVREQQHAEQHEQRARGAVDPHDVGAEALEPREEAVQGVGRDRERHGQPERIDAEQHDSLTDARLGGGEGEDRAENRSHAGGPGRAEGDAHDSRAEIPERLAGELEATLPHQEGRPQLLQRQAGEKADVARDERQDAGRQKAQEPSSERQAEGDAAGGVGRGDQPQKHTAETTVVQRPSSPHSAAEVTFIVRTISPESSHCSRRSSHAFSGSNGTPRTVASMDAARSSAYSPAAISFWP